MDMVQLIIESNSLKKEWSPEEIESAKKKINRFFEITADWDNSIKDMGLTYEITNHHAALRVSGDFYLDEGIRIDSFVLLDTGELVLIGIEDNDELSVYYKLDEY